MKKNILLPLFIVLFFAFAKADNQFKQSIGFPDAASEFLSVCETPDSGYVYFGNVTDTVSDKSKLFLVKMNFEGTLLWSKKYGGSDIDEGNDMIIDDNDHIVVAGYTYSFGTTLKSSFAFSTDGTGNVI